MIVEITDFVTLAHPIGEFQHAATVIYIDDSGVPTGRPRTMYVGPEVPHPQIGGLAEARHGKVRSKDDLICSGRVDLDSVPDRKQALQIAQNLSNLATSRLETANRLLKNAIRLSAETEEICNRARYLDLWMEQAEEEGCSRLSGSSYDALGRIGIETVRDLLAYSFEGLLDELLEDEGHVAIEAVAWLKTLGLKLAPYNSADTV